MSRCVRGQLVYEPDVTLALHPFPRLLAGGGFRSLVAAPLLVESQVFGVLVAARRQPQGFSSGECEFLKQVTEHAALAAKQAELHGALQTAYEDLRQTQQSVMQQERLRALGQMASGVAHDINNAISPVMLYTEFLLEKEANLSARTRSYLQTIQQAVGDVAETVARMKEFYREREPQLSLTPVQLNTLSRQVVDLTRARWSDMALRRGNRHRGRHRTRRRFAGGDGHRERNSRGADKPGAQCRGRTAKTAARSPCVPESRRERRLRAPPPLRRRDASSSKSSIRGSAWTKARGSGAWSLSSPPRASAEPVSVSPWSMGPCSGTAPRSTFKARRGSAPTIRLSFVLPRSDAEAGIPAGSVPVLPSHQRILVVDDDLVLLKSLRDALEGDGHGLVMANGGEQGIEIFLAALNRGEGFSVVITDLGMPYVDGRKVAAAVKAASPSTPVILLTGWGQRMAAEGEIPPHVDRVLSKPPKLGQLRTALAELTSDALEPAAASRDLGQG